MTFTRDQLLQAFPNQPLLVAQFVALDRLVSDQAALIVQLQDALAAAGVALDSDTRWQPASDILTNIAALDGQAGAIVLVGNGQSVAQPVDTSDDASLLSKSRADGLYAPHA